MPMAVALGGEATHTARQKKPSTVRRRAASPIRYRRIYRLYGKIDGMFHGITNQLSDLLAFARSNPPPQVHQNLQNNASSQPHPEPARIIAIS